MSDTYVRASTVLGYQKANTVESAYNGLWKFSSELNVSNLAPWGLASHVDVFYSTKLEKLFTIADTRNNITKGVFQEQNSNWFNDWRVIPTHDMTARFSYDEFDEVESSYTFIWKGVIPEVDINTGTPWGKAKEVDSVITKTTVNSGRIAVDQGKSIRWGYNINNFLIGGVDLPSNPEDGLVETPFIEYTDYEVYFAVNSVIATVRPTSQQISFENFSMSIDIESFAWSMNFDVKDRESFDLIRPQGKNVKTVDVDINGDVYSFIISKSLVVKNQGKTRYRCSGWTPIKLLADPYAARKSFTDTTQRTAAQIIDRELIGYPDYSYTWSTVDWLIPQGIHSYQNRTPLGAMLDVINSVGAVMIPHPTNTSFDVQPYYPANPWDWPTTSPDRVMNETQFFQISDESVPGSDSNAVFVYGEESNGVAVKAVRNGTSGDVVIPDVVNKYMTANDAAQERGRIEICKSSFMQFVTMTTYVDVANGIIKTQDLIRFTDTDDNEWYGMVISVAVTCSQVGNALRQTITVARYYGN